MQNEYALRACRASASPVSPLELGGFQKPLTLIVTGSVGSSTGAETCTSSASAGRVSRKRRTVDLGETKAGLWGCVG